MNQLRRRERHIAALVIVLLGFAIRAYGLGGDSLWVDEILTLASSRGSLLAPLQNPPPDHPPLLYVLTTVALNIWGESEFSARIFSLVAATLGVALMIALGNVIKRPFLGLWAALFLALSPLHLRYAHEARHYALLMSVSLLTFILLYQGMVRPRWRPWIGYGLATAVNLYTHYGAFVVLATQIVLVVAWSVIMLHRREPRLLLFPAAAGSVAVALFAPWLSRFQMAVDKNVGEAVVSPTGTATSITMWLQEAFYSFGMYQGVLPWLMATFVALGFLFWFWRWNRSTALFFATGLFLPFVFIQVFNIARGAFVRYVIYAMPFYLFVAAVVPAVLTHQVLRFGNRRLFSVATVLLALIFARASWPALLNEYAQMHEDWRGILEYLDGHAHEDDAILGLSLSSEIGFNLVKAAFPYYLDRHTSEYRLFPSGHMTPAMLHQLSAQNGQVWAVASNWSSEMAFAASTVTVTEFWSHLHVVEDSDGVGTTLDMMIHMVERLLPKASTPVPRCLLYQDLAALYAAGEDYLKANQHLLSSISLCPEAPHTTGIIRAEVKTDVATGLQNMLLAASADDDAAAVVSLAQMLLIYNPRDNVALDALAVFNLMQRYQQGEVDVMLHGAPEPVQVRTYVMPDTGDGGDVLFVHPPAAVSFHLSLPEAPTLFYSRVALDPQSWNWGGDGVTFVLTLTAKDGTIELLRYHLDNTASGHGWHEVRVPLSPYEGQEVTLTLATEIGPNGNGIGDWAGWEMPRIMDAGSFNAGSVSK